jgi:hypothetical protein
MLRFERQVVAALVTTSDDSTGVPTTAPDSLRTAVESYVEGALRSMPQHLRAGLAAESLLLGAWAARPRVGGRGKAALVDQLEAWDASRIDLLRQYVRLLRSLVLFAENELQPGAAR